MLVNPLQPSLHNVIQVNKITPSPRLECHIPCCTWSAQYQQQKVRNFSCFRAFPFLRNEPNPLFCELYNLRSSIIKMHG